MIVLGIHIGHDSSAALIVDGTVVADVAEERFNRIKHFAGIPFQSINFCLKHANITMDQVTALATTRTSSVFNELFVLNGKKRIPETLQDKAIRMYSIFSPQWGKQLPLYVNRFPLASGTPIIKVPHHLAHASSAFYTSGFSSKCLIVTMDGIGDSTSVALWEGNPENGIKCLKTFGGDASLGWFYGNATEALGWWHGDGEGKTMGLAPYGEPTCVSELLRFCPEFRKGELIRPHDFGNVSCWNNQGALHWHFDDSNKMKSLVDAHSREDFAASAQKILETQAQELIYQWMSSKGLKNLCCSGGIFLNVKLNQRILSSGVCDDLFVYPNAGDSGLAVGAALHVCHEMAGDHKSTRIEHLYSGPSFDNNEIEKALRLCGLRYHRTDNSSQDAASRLADGKIVAWFQGQMESGPRALGNRSILVSANKAENKDILNERVKFREGFRPFCPSLTDEKRDTYLKNPHEAPFMIISFDVTDDKRNKVPAVVHRDGTLRPQTVKRSVNPKYWSLIDSFGQATGEYLVLNTSFNIMGEPIVTDPLHAVRCFYGCGLDSLVIGDFVIDK